MIYLPERAQVSEGNWSIDIQNRVSFGQIAISIGQVVIHGNSDNLEISVNFPFHRNVGISSGWHGYV
jgi:hypothetical protein